MMHPFYPPFSISKGVIQPVTVIGLYPYREFDGCPDSSGVPSRRMKSEPWDLSIYRYRYGWE